MSGHSAWKNIKHKKAATDARRGKAWSKCARAIIVAARNGGGDPDANLSLRYAIDEARSHNMPRDTIDKAVKKGTGELQGVAYEPAVYEGYGPGGVAILLDILTDNRNRTSSDVKVLFLKYGGNLGAAGCVSYIFQTRGLIAVPKSAADEDKIMTVALDAGALDVTAPPEAPPDSPPDGPAADPKMTGPAWSIICQAQDLFKVHKAIESAGIAVTSAEITRIPNNTITVRGVTDGPAHQLLALIEALEDHDDVQKVHANFEIPDEELAEIK